MSTLKVPRPEMQPFSDINKSWFYYLASGSSKKNFTMIYEIFHIKFLTMALHIIHSFYTDIASLFLLKSTEKYVYFDRKPQSCLISFLQVSPSLSDCYMYMVIYQKFDISLITCASVRQCK